MAIGLGMMFGFRTPENFNYPYCAVSIQDFWRRWHITLSSWFRDYLYIPLGGNRKGSSRTFVHLLVVFLLCGLWHGANWTFVVWGLFHGLFLGLERLGLSRLLDRSPKALRYVYVMSVVSIGWVFFRSATITHAGSYLAAMFGFARGDGIRFPIDAYITPEIVFLIAVGTLLSTPVMEFAKKASRWPHPTAWKEAIRQTGLLVIFLLSLITIVSGSHPSFIYFQF
jgi:alginate O-acetyltransferase complex protein AlgI